MKALTYVEIDVPLYLAHDRAVALGSTNYFVRGAGLTGASDGKQMTFSGWVRRDAGVSGRLLTSVTTLGGSTGRARAVFNASNQFQLLGYNSAGVEILNILSSVITPDVWHHVMASVDLSNVANRHLYVDGVSDLLTVTTYTDDTIDLTQADWGIGAYPDGTNQLEGGLADIWFDDSYIDLSVEANRRGFISAAGFPVLLGDQGEYPTGSQPLVYMTGSADDWHTNLGSGGAFTPEEETDDALDFPLQFIETFRYAAKTSYLPKTIDAIPSVESVSVTPGTVSLGKDLGTRANVDVSFKDHRHVFEDEPWTRATYWSKFRGRYGMTLRGRPLRVIRGAVGQAFESMSRETYLIDACTGPSINGDYSITAKDLLRLADSDQAQAPRVSNGSLAGSIDSDDTAITLSPAGIGDLEYAASGWVCLSGKEVVSFTRAADVMTIVRAQFGSLAQSHASGDRVQTVLRFAGNTVAEILQTLLEDYARIDPSYIPITDWETEVSTYLNVIYARTITEPTSVKKLIEELIDQAALALWWEPQASELRLRVLREIDTTQLISEDAMTENTLQVAEQPDSRNSQIWTYYGRRDATNRTDQEDGFRAARVTADLEKEEVYNNTPAIRKVMGSWIETDSAAQRVNEIQLSRFKDPPRRFAFSMWSDQLIELGKGYQLSWRNNVDARGNPVTSPIQIVRVRREHDFIFVEAEEMLASGVIVLVNVIFLTTTGSLLDLEVPAGWNDSDNSIHTIAPGAGGGGSGGGGGGGGGGAYSGVSNVALTPLALIPYRVGTPGVGSSTNGTNGSDTWFGDTTLAASIVGAKAGIGATGQLGGSGGLASGGVGTVKTSGGDGGNGGPSGGDGNIGGGGGGGAGGPNGNGADGGSCTATGADAGAGGGGANGGFDAADNGDIDPSSGGHNRFSFGGGAGINGEAGASGVEGGGGGGGGRFKIGGPGGAGEQLWTQTIPPIQSGGPGGGGGGGGSHSVGGIGGLFGGGGGGAGRKSSGAGGAQGLIVLTWRE